MADNNRKAIVANVLWMTFDKVFMLILNLLVMVKVANHYGVNDYGDYQYAVSVVAVLEILVAFVDGRVVKKKYLNTKPEQVVFNASICRLIFAFLSALIGSLLILFDNRSNEYAWMFVFLLINAIIINLRFGMTNRFEYLLKSKKVVIAQDCSFCLSAVLQLIAVKLRWPIVMIAVIAAFSSIVNLLLVFVQYQKEFAGETKGQLDKKLIALMIRESLPLAIAASCSTIYSRCDSIMLGNMLTSVEVGIYAIAVKLISVVQIAIAPIRESVYPQLVNLYSTDKEAYAKKYIRITSILTWIYIIGVVCSFVVLPVAFQFLNSEYANAYPVYCVYVLGTFFMYNAALRAGHFTMINRGSILMYSQVFSVLVNIVLNYVGITCFGLLGAALATVVTQFMSLFISNLFFGKAGREVFKWQILGLNPVRIFM